MNSIRTLALTLALLAAGAAAQTLYFYPPDNAKWIAGRAYISNGQDAEKFDLDSTRCGWYKKNISGDLLEFAQFWLGKPGKDRIGPKGKLVADFDSSVTKFDNEAGVFKLGEMFNNLGKTIYFVADELNPDDPSAGWYNSDPTTDNEDLKDESRCKFELAAFIYDTDVTVHPDFSCGEYNNGAKCTTGGKYSSAEPSGIYGKDKSKCTGVLPGVVVDELGADRKIKYNQAGDKWGCWTDGDWFDKAFNPTENVNIERCYNMPFKLVKSGPSAGSFEFDSDKLTSEVTGNLVGGFFPYDLTPEGSANVDYSKCPNCKALRAAECFVPLDKKISVADFDNRNNEIGDFKDGDTPPNMWDWGARDKVEWYLHGKDKILGTEKAPANLFFCFESHADFYYDPAQVFYFRGDDDIWVYINKKLVIDMGGGHLAAPGHVILEKEAGRLGLKEGELYPIDIFFCDRRSTQSNVRVSTNMYIAQKSTFFSDPDQNDNYMCVLNQSAGDCKSKMSGSTEEGKMCGPDLISGGYNVDFYMINKANKLDTVWLSVPPPESSGKRGRCTGTGDIFECYNGMKFEKAIYSCQGRFKCGGKPELVDKLGLDPGNWTVYARLTSGGKVVPNTKIIPVDNFKTTTQTNIVWGQMRGEFKDTTFTLKNVYGDEAKREQRIIAGKRTPVYISAGTGWNDSYTVFQFDNDPDLKDTRSYNITVTPANKLKLFANETGDERKTGGKIPLVGYDVVWVEGGYDLEDGAEFLLNVAPESDATPSMKLTVYQPKLRFVDKDFKNQITPSDGYSRWSDLVPYVGKSLDMFVAAWDDERKEICGHCTFPIMESSASTSGCSEKVKGRSDLVVFSGALIITDGKLNGGVGGIRGQEDTGEATCTVSWKLTGPNSAINGEWTGLRFREPPVPIPMENYIYDRNGDGIGDSVTIKFSKSFGQIDSLRPVLLGVEWAPKDTVFYHHPDYKLEDLKKSSYVEGIVNTSFYEKNRKWWDEFVHTDDSLIVITRNPSKDGDARFSSGILTAGTGSIVSWIPFTDCGATCDFAYNPNDNPLQDRIAPIVIAATYTPGSGDCNTGCDEIISVDLSEPVYDVTGTGADDWINPFNYCLLSQTANPRHCDSEISDEHMYSISWNNNDWDWELPQGDNIATRVTYNKSGVKLMGKGDDNVKLEYKRRGDSPTPQAGDWVRIRHKDKGGFVFKDAAGNESNLNERGVIMTGENRTNKDLIQISQIPGPNTPALGGMFDPKSECRQSGECDLPFWFGDEAKSKSEELFQDGKITELLPLPKDYTDADNVRKYYPGSVGAIFKVSDGYDKIQSFVGSCEGCTGVDGKPLKDVIADNLTINASAYYHTNLGDYTAHRDKFAVPCTDKIFSKKDVGGNCFTNKYSFYLPWDLKANSGRSVGAGAYVGISKFYMQLDYIQNGARKSAKFHEWEFIEMYGARRTKAK